MLLPKREDKLSIFVQGMNVDSVKGCLKTSNDSCGHLRSSRCASHLVQSDGPWRSLMDHALGKRINSVGGRKSEFDLLLCASVEV